MFDGTRSFFFWALSILAVLPYLNALGNDFVYDDDQAQIVRNDFVLGRNELTRAEEEFRIAFEEAPGFAPALANLGMTLLRRGSLAEAEKYLTRALEQDPSRAPVYANRGLLSEMRGDRDRAIAMYRRAYALDPELEALRDRAQDFAHQRP